MAKKIYIVYGAEGVNGFIYPFCKAFVSEKKADRYYDRKYIELLEKHKDKTIEPYSICYVEKKIK